MEQFVHCSFRDQTEQQAGGKRNNLLKRIGQQEDCLSYTRKNCIESFYRVKCKSDKIVTKLFSHSSNDKIGLDAALEYISQLNKNYFVKVTRLATKHKSLSSQVGSLLSLACEQIQILREAIWRSSQEGNTNVIRVLYNEVIRVIDETINCLVHKSVTTVAASSQGNKMKSGLINPCRLNFKMLLKLVYQYSTSNKHIYIDYCTSQSTSSEKPVMTKLKPVNVDRTQLQAHNRKLVDKVADAMKEEFNELLAEAYWIACYHNRISVIKLLTQLQDRNVAIRRGRNSWTPLLLSCELCYSDMFMYFMESEKNDMLDVNDATQRGNAVLHSVIWLRQNGGSTQLHKAVKDGDEELVKNIALEMKNVDEQDNLGRTALHIACSYDRQNIVELLLTLWVDVSITNDNGKTPADVAESIGSFEIVKCLSQCL